MFYYALVFIIFLMAPAILGVILAFDLQIDAWINVLICHVLKAVELDQTA
jgi:uncharacterized iron-regulated membrane protein